MTKPSMIKGLSFLAAAAMIVSAFPCAAAYVRGELVWECDFTPDEAAQYGVAGLRFDESGRGAEYEPSGCASRDDGRLSNGGRGCRNARFLGR